MKLGKIIRGVSLGALVLSLIPYQVKKDEQTGALEVRSLLWAMRKTPPAEGESKEHFAFAMPPSGLKYEDAKENEAPNEEPAPEEPAEAPIPE